MVSLLHYSIHRNNQAKWTYAPQYYLHYSYLIVTLVIYLVCCLKLPIFLIKCRIPAGHIRSSGNLPHYLFSFFILDYSYHSPALILAPTPPACVDFVTPWRLCQEYMMLTVPHLIPFFLFCLFGLADAALVV